MPNAKLELDDILSRMQVPEQRRKDLRWLNRNLAFRNSEHGEFDRACELIKQLMREEF